MSAGTDELIGLSLRIRKLRAMSPAEVAHRLRYKATIARERRVQLIVMGLSCERGVFATRPGSIAYRVLCSSTVPVLVVPAAEG